MSKQVNHQHNTCSNSHESFRTFIGCRITGFISDALPIGRADLSQGTKTFIFECGWGLTVASNGSYWSESPVEIARAVAIVKDALDKTQGDLREVLQIAGINGR